jgi:23S rRNA (adenine1618-N6)-methyltransferase
MPQPPKRPAASTVNKGVLHPRNRHQGRYDFAKMIKACPELASFVILNRYGKQSIDFADPAAVKVFNRALLQQYYGIAHWDIPDDYLCPPIPGRADYVHSLADLLAESNGGVIPRGANVEALDIGIGANCIYPLIGHHEYNWRFVGADIDATALASAKAILQGNQLTKTISLRQQSEPNSTFQNVIAPEDRFDITLCNPPFHTSLEEARSGSRRKWKNLGKLDSTRKLPVLNFGGQGNELWCKGGEARFVRTLAEESARYGQQVFWFSTLVSKASNVDGLEAVLKRTNAVDIRTIDMSQGQKRSRLVAWTFLSPEAQQQWRLTRWLKNAN